MRAFARSNRNGTELFWYCGKLIVYVNVLWAFFLNLFYFLLFSFDLFDFVYSSSHSRNLVQCKCASVCVSVCVSVRVKETERDTRMCAHHNTAWAIFRVQPLFLYLSLVTHELSNTQLLFCGGDRVARSRSRQYLLFLLLFLVVSIHFALWQNSWCCRQCYLVNVSSTCATFGTKAGINWFFSLLRSPYSRSHARKRTPANQKHMYLNIKSKRGRNQPKRKGLKQQTKQAK